MREEATDLEVEKWDKLKSWTKVQEEIEERLKNTEKYDDSMTLYYGPQVSSRKYNPWRFSVDFYDPQVSTSSRKYNPWRFSVNIYDPQVSSRKYNPWRFSVDFYGPQVGTGIPLIFKYL